MPFITIPTEQTTALTDAMLGVEALLLAGFLQRFVKMEAGRARCWQIVLLLTATASLIGSVAHGFVMSKAMYEALWKPLLLTLGLIVASLVLAAVYDLFGPRAAQRARPWLLGVAVGFFAITFVPGMTFLIFILYEAVGMLFCLGAYGRLALGGRLAGSAVIAIGIILQLVAAGVQSSGPFQITLVWPFDHNGVFHIIGMVATAVMIGGVAKGFHHRRTEPGSGN